MTCPKTMTLRELVAAYPEAFYRQSWYDMEAFMSKTPRPWLGWPAGLMPFLPLPEADLPYSAADLALLWLENSDHPMWEHYLWTCDMDAQGQRVYVGQNGRGLEIHRHLHLTERWGVPA